MKSARELTADDLAAFHDAELCQVLMGRSDNTLRLVFELDTGREQMICFTDIRDYKISEIYTQNVVSRLRLSSLGMIPEEELRWILAWMRDRDEQGRAKLLERVTPRELADIQEGSYFLLYLEPSVGAEVAVIAQQMTIGL